HGSGSGAGGSALMKVTGVSITTNGTGYTSAPTVSFSNGGGSGAAATASLQTIDGSFQVAVGIDHFSITGAPSSVTSGASISGFTVKALDSSSNVESSYTGTIHFTTTDTATGHSVPADYTF